jgi:hypothetical protein
MVKSWPHHQIDNLVRSFEERLRQMVAAKGGKFVYRDSKSRKRDN